mmetsp:Transcript_22076/g.54041  ORF Transcript_22076/g.54041 Transcript_22076/m.54041 type:complete len:174 (-) Transcript_22076:205-726(-)
MANQKSSSSSKQRKRETLHRLNGRKTEKRRQRLQRATEKSLQRAAKTRNWILRTASRQNPKKAITMIVEMIVATLTMEIDPEEDAATAKADAKGGIVAVTDDGGVTEAGRGAGVAEIGEEEMIPENEGDEMIPENEGVGNKTRHTHTCSYQCFFCTFRIRCQDAQNVWTSLRH